MKIVFYINTLGGGGAERVVATLAKSLSINRDVIVVNSYSVANEYKLSDKVKHIYLEEENKETGNYLSRNFRRVSLLRSIIKSEKPDVLISFMAEPNFRAVVASIGLKNKLIISVRNDPNKEYPTTFKRLLAKTLFRFVDGIVFQTEDAKKWFPKSIQKKSAIIYNQVDEVFYNTVFRGARHDIITTGRLTPQKNHKMLIQAFAKISDRVTDNLIIYGEGELRNELSELISELNLENRVFLPGRIANVAETIKSAKLFVLSSDYEGMPNSLMEAMALGIPCISTDCPCGGPRELFGSYSKERLIPCGDIDGLSNTIYKMLTKHGDESIEKGLSKKFHSKRIGEKWKKYISGVVKNTN